MASSGMPFETEGEGQSHSMLVMVVMRDDDLDELMMMMVMVMVLLLGTAIQRPGFQGSGCQTKPGGSTEQVIGHE